MKRFLSLFQGIAFAFINHEKVGSNTSVGLGSILFFRRLLHFFIGVVLLVAGTFSGVQAQQMPGTNDAGFNTADVKVGEGMNGEVRFISLQSDGKAIVNGGFNAVNAVSRNGATRLNVDGSLDSAYNPNAGPMAIQSDDRLIAMKGTTTSSGTVTQLVRLNTDGSPDNSFNAESVNNYVILTVVQQEDKKILVGGNFKQVNNEASGKIARLNADGSLDDSFKPDFTVDNFSFVSIITLQSDGKAIVGIRAGSSTGRNYLVRLNTDGTLDDSFDTGAGFNGHIKAIAVQRDGKVLVGGNFTSLRGTPCNLIARLNPDGSLDTTFSTGNGFKGTDIFGSVESIAVQSDGKVVAGGEFSTYDGTNRKNIARLNSDGTLDSSFDPGTGFYGAGSRNNISALALQRDGKLVVGGWFSNFNGTIRNMFARLNADGSLDEAYNRGTGFDSYTVNTVALQRDGKIVVGGDFSSFNGIACNKITRLNADGSLDRSYNTGTGLNWTAEAIVLQQDGKAIVVGSFSSFNGTSRNRIVRLNTDGSLDDSFDPGTGFNGTVRTVALQRDGKMVVGGTFTIYNGAACNRIVRLNADGTMDTSFNTGTGFNYHVYVIVVQEDGKLVVGGDFNSYNGINRSMIARLNADGTLDATFNPGTVFNFLINAIALQRDGKIVAVGEFTAYNGNARNRIARLNADGSLDSSFNPGTGFNSGVKTITLQTDGKMIAGGFFTAFNGSTRNRIVRLNADGSPDDSFNTGAGFNNNVFKIILQPDGKIIVGGAFVFLDNTPRNRIARLHNDGLPLNTVNDLYSEPQILLYPNPTQSDINLEFSGAEALVGGAKLILYNAMGRKVLTREVSASEAQAGVQLATTGLASGVYFLKVSTRSGIATKRVVLTDK